MKSVYATALAIVALAVSSASAAWVEDFNALADGKLSGQGGWYGSSNTEFSVSGGKTVITGQNGSSWANHAVGVSSGNGVWTIDLQLQKKTGASSTSAIVDVFFETNVTSAWPSGFTAGWRIGPIQARGRQDFWGAPSNKTGWQAFQGTEANGLWDTFTLQFDQANDIVGYYFTPAGGATVWLFDSSVDLSGVTSIDVVRMNTITQTATTQAVNLDNIMVTPEPAALALLLLGGLTCVRRRRA